MKPIGQKHVPFESAQTVEATADGSFGTAEDGFSCLSDLGGGEAGLLLSAEEEGEAEEALAGLERGEGLLPCGEGEAEERWLVWRGKKVCCFLLRKKRKEKQRWLVWRAISLVRGKEKQQKERWLVWEGKEVCCPFVREKRGWFGGVLW
jgi:hypothetical protein